MEEKNQNNNQNPWVIGGSIVIAGIIIAVGLFYAVGSKNEAVNPAGDTGGKVGGLEIGDAPVLGNADAPVTIVEFGDFQCPYCAMFSAQMDPQIREKFVQTGKAKVVFKTLNFIDSFDGNKDPQESLLSGIAGECAKEQGKFWPMHDAIYQAESEQIQAKQQSENDGNLNREFFKSVAVKTNLNIDQFLSCLESGKYEAQLKKYMDEADKAMNGKISTPSVFVNGKQLNNPFDISEYEEIIK